MAVAATRPVVRVSKTLARAFRAEGVREIFGLMGAANMEFISHFSDLEGCRVLAFRHENTAVAAADGFARASGTVGVATFAHGPGLTPVATSLVTAARAHTPLVLFTGSPDGGLQSMDQRSLIEACECTWLPYRSMSDVADAFYIARTRRTTVVLGVPTQVQEKEAPEADYLTRQLPRSPRVAPQPADIKAAADLIAAATSPVILAGRGALGMSADLDELADLLGAPLTTTLPVKGELARGRNAVGTAGGYATEAASAALKAADCVIAIGSSLSGQTTENGKLIPLAKVIHIDMAAGKARVGLPIVADAALALPALIAELRGRSIKRLAREAAPAADPLDAELKAFAPQLEPNRLDPRLLMRALDRALPNDAIIVVDNGHFSGFVCMYLGNGSGRHFEFTDSFDAIGQSLPTAIGVAVARPDRAVVAISGDAGLMYNLQEIDTMGRYCPNLLSVIVNDDGLGAEYHKLKEKDLDPARSEYRNPSFAGIAELMGVRGLRAESIDAVEPFVRAFAKERRASLLDAAVSRAVVTPRYRSLLAGRHH